MAAKRTPPRPAAKRAATPAARPVAAPVHVPAATPSVSHTKSSSIQGTSMEEIISGLLQVRASFGSALSELSAKLTAEATRLQELRSHIETTSRQIRELHGSDVTDSTLRNIVVEYQQASEAHSKAIAEKQEAFDRELQETRRAWDKEKTDRARTVQEDNEAYGKVQQREQQEANYVLTQKRELDNDAYEHQKKHREADLTDYTKGQHKAWDEREKLIADQEKAYNEAKQKVDEAPKQLEAAVKKAREEGKAIAFSQAKIKGDLIAKDIEGEKRVFDLKIKSLEDSNKEQAGRVDSLTKLLATTLAQAQNLAVKSIEGASNASTYVAVKEIALEQAKNMPKNKG